MNKKLLCIYAILISGFFLHIGSHNISGEWFVAEQTYYSQRKQYVAQQYWNKNVIGNVDYDHSLIKQIFTSQSIDQIKSKDSIQLFDQSIQNRDYEQFSRLIQNVNNFGISVIEYEEKLSVPLHYGNFYPCKNDITITFADRERLQHYISDSSFSGIVSIQALDSACTAASSNIADYSIPFAIHSISKIFTELLLVILIQENIIPQSALDRSLYIDQKIKQLLPISIVDQLEKVTMRQIMEHRGGFGDYTIGYFDDLVQKVKNKETIPHIEKLEDFLRYAEDTIFDLAEGESRYSNLGILLLGLSIEYHYNAGKQDENYHSFEQILRKYIIEPAGMNIFSSQRPIDGCYNEFGLCAQYICATSAGGHWTTVEDMHKFARWLRNKYLTDDQFKELCTFYFYNDDFEEIHHCGGIGQAGIGESSARFALFLKHGISVVILSNRSQQAFTMYQTLYHNIFADQG